VNGSGKHNNWSMADSDGDNLLEPGTTPHDNAQFLAFLAAVVRAVYKHANQLRAAVAVAGNDHRLGANEAPPAIISMFLGSQLTEVVENIIAGKGEASKHGGFIEVGVSTLPNLPKDATDRNRTSPFAFTGNKFEFRAVGSSQCIADAGIVLNAIVAESLDYLATRLEAAVAGGAEFNAALQSLLQEIFTECQPILFDGDNYSEEWVEEAARRGLPNLKSAIDALPCLLEPDARALFTGTGIFTERELESRYAIKVEAYIKAINIEALLTEQMARTMILPAAIKYQGQVATSLVATKQVIGEMVSFGPQEEMLAEVAQNINSLKAAIDHLSHTCCHEGEDDLLAHAAYFRDTVIPAMLEVRKYADALETVVDDELWTLPKYREMLFIY